MAEQLAGADAEVKRINALISTADHAGSFVTACEKADGELANANGELRLYRQHLDSTSRTLFDDLSDFYNDLLLEDFSAPNVRESFISSKDFLPYIDGKKFDAVSISGGNRYYSWTSVLS
ncbi:hypothetical protein ACFWTE_03620 [Nocardiopsis sp. NPDC058631]|uniref:hypothetical protein n=1 Tax=Nocardiopsis sp. NPDC058631 TaxID=3346566 RepID=UPI00366A3C40